MCIHGVYMAGKLYWRVKIDGKWTWRPAGIRPAGELPRPEDMIVKIMEEEE